METHIYSEELLELYAKGNRIIENAWISGPGLEEANLSGLTLRNVRLHEVNLSKADLSRANLQQVTIEFCRLHQTNMTGAIFRDVTIRHCQLPGIILQGANLQQVIFQPSTPDQPINLQNAILRFATLISVDLRGANLFGADLVAAYFNDVDISGADLRQVLVGQTSMEENVKRDAATLWQPLLVTDPSTGSTRRRRAKGQSRNTGEISANASNEYIVIPGKNSVRWTLAEAREKIQCILQERFGRSGRKGQPKFRADIFRVYQARCAITGCCVEATLEAAHIYPHCLTQNNEPSNGILLRRDLHELFDRNLLKIDPITRQVVLDSSIEDAEDYRHLNGKIVHPPPTFNSNSYRVWIEALTWRRDEYYKLAEGFVPDKP